MSDPFVLYESATTQADLYRRQGGVHEGFGAFMSEPAVDPESVDLSAIVNPTPEKEDFLKLAFSTRFHVVYGNFGSNPFGPGNNIMFAFDQVDNRLRMGRITEAIGEHVLPPSLNVTSSSVTFTGGDDLDIIFTSTPHTYTRQVNGDPDAEPVRVYNIQARKVGETSVFYNYFVVPISF